MTVFSPQPPARIEVVLLKTVIIKRAAPTDCAANASVHEQNFHGSSIHMIGQKGIRQDYEETSVCDLQEMVLGVTKQCSRLESTLEDPA